MDELPNYKDIPLRSEYAFDCPVGVWRARLVAKAWGKNRNILLYFSELKTGNRYCILIFRAMQYTPNDRTLSFREAGKPGEVLELETERTSTGRTKLMSARIIASTEDGSASIPGAPEALTPVA